MPEHKAFTASNGITYIVPICADCGFIIQPDDPPGERCSECEYQRIAKMVDGDRRRRSEDRWRRAANELYGL